MDNGDAASSNNAPLHEGAGPSNSPLIPSMGEVFERIHQLQMELADRTLQLGRMTIKYNRDIVQEAHSVREIA